MDEVGTPRAENDDFIISPIAIWDESSRSTALGKRPDAKLHFKG